MAEVLLYQRQDGRSPFAEWFDDLHTQAAAKVTVAIERLKLGNFSNMKSVGEGVQEFRIDWGPGYRLYLGRDGEKLVILLTGGTSSGSTVISPMRKRSGRITSGGDDGRHAQFQSNG